MLFGVIGFAIGCFVGGALVFFAFALVAAGADEEEMRERLRRDTALIDSLDDDLK